MSPTNSQKNSFLQNEDWADNLLVKDKMGKFNKPKSTGERRISPMLSKIGPESTDEAITQSPKDDSFRPHASEDKNPEEKASLVFHPDDQSQFEQMGNTLGNDDSQKYSVEKIVEKIVEKHQLKFDAPTKQKFTDSLYNFFRGRKKAMVLREEMNTFKTSGKKIGQANIDSIVSVVKGIKTKIDLEGGLVVNAEEMAKFKQSAIKKAEDLALDKPEERPDAESVKKDLEAAIRELEKETEEQQKEDQPAPEKPKFNLDDKVKTNAAPRTAVSPGGFEIPEEKQTKEKEEEVQPQTKQSSTNPDKLPKVVRPNQQVNKQAADVVSKANIGTRQAAGEKEFVLTGPVQELKNMSLKNFRYLGDSVSDRMEKLIDKFNVLEQDSFTKRAQGIEAWRTSPVYKMYLKLGSESMDSNKNLESIIAEYKERGEQMLTAEEFEAVSDLNQKLRF